MQRLDSPAAMAAWSEARWRGGRIGLVPTMGALHAGHAALMDAVRPRCDHLIVSVFVNPLQFGAGEDLDAYPRTLAADLAVCAAHGVDAVFAPTVMYPPDFGTTVHVAGLTTGLCGASRPTHFDGVTTVVARLFGVCRADIAAFGEKDYQQLAVIRRMVRDLALPVEIVGVPTVREPDGLALSSRNIYLSAAQRARAVSLSGALRAMRDAVGAGTRDVDALRAIGRAALDVDRLDYLEVVDATDLTSVQTVDRPARALVAAFLGDTRLIDNLDVSARR